MTRLFSAAFALLLAVSVLGLDSTATAQDAATEGAIKYRKSVMKTVGGNMGAIVGIIKGSGDKADLTLHTGQMAKTSMIVGKLFPEGSDFGETTALPVIWEKPDDFAKAVKMMQDAAAGINTAAASGDMAVIGPALGKLGESCKNCHENFREKKERKK